jgi:hypothetical protein
MVNKVNSLKFTLRFFGRKSFLKDPFRIFQFLVALEYLGQRKLTLINEKPNKIFNKFSFTCFPFYFPKNKHSSLGPLPMFLSLIWRHVRYTISPPWGLIATTEGNCLGSKLVLNSLIRIGSGFARFA